MTRITRKTTIENRGGDASALESAIADLRSAWTCAERVGGVDSDKLKKDISRSVARLKQRIQKSTNGAPANFKECPLFDRNGVRPISQATVVHRVQERVQGQAPERFPEPALRVYAKDLTAHALQHFPKLAGCQSLDEIRAQLVANLRFNALETRRRNANFLISRYFPGKALHTDLLPFAAAVAGQRALSDALFYLTARAEKIVALVADEVVFPSLATGSVSRAKIRDFIQSQFPDSKSAQQMGAAVVATYQAFGIAHANRTKLDVCLREGSLAAFAYILHLEFPEPGMYSFERLLDGPLHKWLLWDQQWMVRQLYRLREVGLLSKVSEIDRMRQFTTKFPLAQAVQPIVALAKDSPP